MSARVASRAAYAAIGMASLLAAVGNLSNAFARPRVLQHHAAVAAEGPAPPFPADLARLLDFIAALDGTAILLAGSGGIALVGIGVLRWHDSDARRGLVAVLLVILGFLAFVPLLELLTQSSRGALTDARPALFLLTLGGALAWMLRARRGLAILAAGGALIATAGVLHFAVLTPTIQQPLTAYPREGILSLWMSAAFTLWGTALLMHVAQPTRPNEDGALPTAT